MVWHRFDFILVIISLLELGLADIRNLSVLHSFTLVSEVLLVLLITTFLVHPGILSA